MPDIIQLLPDHVANQIAAGEVIQRPSSAVKELLENAIDAGATKIDLIVEEAGKTLVQVIDNGKGMTETDARLCFERHATSKIEKIEDIFKIRTMGFRGEALASIAAVAQVTLKTKTNTHEMGTEIEIENSKVIAQKPAAINNGTSIAMKNLFFNVPARRNFLKSNPVELRHIIEEFTRIALAFPEIQFTLTSNGAQQFFLEKGSLKQRIIQLFNNSWASKLIQVKEQTDYLNIIGFIGKPEIAKKTRGDQYFYVNNRFIKSAYLNHAVTTAFESLLPKDSYPMYVLFIDIDPKLIDVNVHPTKQEIKFDDERIVYAFVQSSIKHALAQNSVMGSLEFDLDATIQQTEAVQMPFTNDKILKAKNTTLFETFTRANEAHKIDLGKQRNLPQHQQATHAFFMPDFSGSKIEQAPVVENITAIDVQANEVFKQIKPFQWLNSYIVYPNQNTIYFINQQFAHERILYDNYTKKNEKQFAKQNLIFPENFECSAADAVLLTEMIPQLNGLGYEIEPFGNNSFIINATPAEFLEAQSNPQKTIEKLLEQVKFYNKELKIDWLEKLNRAVAAQHAIKIGKPLTDEQVQDIITKLFAGSQPEYTPGGKKIFYTINNSDIEKILK